MTVPLANAFAAAAALAARVERPGARRVLRLAAAGACGDAPTFFLPGCNLRCVHCWAEGREEPERFPWLTVAQMRERLLAFRRHNRLGAAPDRVRLSGGEPVIGEGFLELIEGLLGLPGTVFVETNGVLLGRHPDWARWLAATRGRVVLTVSLKAGTPDQFERLTGAQAEAFEAVFTALDHLLSAGASFDCNALTRAVELFSAAERSALLTRLRRLSPRLPELLTEEELTPYPATVRRMAAQPRD